MAGNVMKKILIPNKVVVLAGYSKVHHYLQLASHKLALAENVMII